MKKIIVLLCLFLIGNKINAQDNNGNQITSENEFYNKVFWAALPGVEKKAITQTYDEYKIVYSITDSILSIPGLPTFPYDITYTYAVFDKNNKIQTSLSSINLTNILNNDNEILNKYDLIKSEITKVFGEPKYFSDKIRNKKNDEAYSNSNWANISYTWYNTPETQINLVYDKNSSLMAIETCNRPANKYTKVNAKLDGTLGCKWEMTQNEVREILENSKNAEEFDSDDKNVISFGKYKFANRYVTRSWFSFVENKLYNIHFLFDPYTSNSHGMSYSYGLYNDIVNEISTKYGKPTLSFNKFENELSRSVDNMAYEELWKGTAEIRSTWFFEDDNVLVVYIGKRGNVNIEYVYAKLVKKSNAEQEY